MLNAACAIGAAASEQDYYAARIAALGLDGPAARQALAAATAAPPSPEAPPPPHPPGNCGDVRQAMAAFCDPQRRAALDQALAVFAAGCQPQPEPAPALPGKRATPPPRSWRHEVRPPHRHGVHVLAARDPVLGLLLGAGMEFYGAFGPGRSETLPPGLVLAGPRLALPPGRHWLEAAIALPPSAPLWLDIVSNRGLRHLAQLETSGALHASIGFRTEAVDDAVEIRLFHTGEKPIAARIKHLAIRP
jgi:hypothetical protein